MRSRFLPALSLAAALASTTGASEPPSNARVGGDLEATATFDAARGEWAAGSSRIDTALPAGYPPPTPPGAIEIKTYPAARRAEFTGTGRSSGDGAFWPLFRHIQRHDIAMTSPVEMDYTALGAQAPADRAWTMSFLYRTPDMNAPGADATDPRVVVRDVPAVTVVSLGGRGSYDESRIARDAEALLKWLDESPEWEPAGSPRALLYNGPSWRPARKWLEVQVPVRPEAPPEKPQ